MKRIDHLMAGVGLLLILIAFTLDRGLRIKFAYASYLYGVALVLFLASYFIGRKRR